MTAAHEPTAVPGQLDLIDLIPEPSDALAEALPADRVLIRQACADAKHRCRGWVYVITTGWHPYQRDPCTCPCHD